MATSTRTVAVPEGHAWLEAVERDRSLIDSITKDNLPKYLEKLELMYGCSVDSAFSGMTFQVFLDLVLKAFKIPKDGKFAASDMEKFINVKVAEAIQLFQRMNEVGLLEDMSIKIRINNVLAFINAASHMINQMYHAFVIQREYNNMVAYDPHTMPVLPGVAIFQPFDMAETKDFHKLLLHMLSMAKQKHYRKFNGDCYTEKYTSDGLYTYAWERKCSIKEFVYECTTKELYFDMWKYLTQQRGNAAGVVEYLTHCKDYEFPDLVRDRHIFSFKNGVYIASWNGIRDTFWSFDGDKCLPKTVVACKHFDMPFDNFDGVAEWYDIPTPYMQSIMDYQGFDPDVSSWMYILMGRLIYEVGEMDGWQVIPFLKGAAGSGKSTITLKVCSRFYEKADVGILSNNIERKFGISAFCDKYLFVAPEIKSDLQMEQAEFQSIVSGEDIQINMKFQKASSAEWKVPGILAGNEVPNWADNMGSISRRCVVFDFVKNVQDGDMELAKKLDLEMPAILKKCNKAYLEAAAMYGKKNIWKILPEYFCQTRADLEEAVNSMEHFLGSGKIIYGRDLYCKYDEFIQAYKLHVDENNFPKRQVTKDFLRTPLAKKGIMVRHENLVYPLGSGREPQQTSWVFGADFANRGASITFTDY